MVPEPGYSGFCASVLPIGHTLRRKTARMPAAAACRTGAIVRSGGRSHFLDRLEALDKSRSGRLTVPRNGADNLDIRRLIGREREFRVTVLSRFASSPIVR